MERKAFIVVDRNSAYWGSECLTRKPDIKGAGIICTIPAETPQELIKIIGGEYGWRSLNGKLRPAIVFPENLFSPQVDNESLLRYHKGPLDLFLAKAAAETYIFFVETVIFTENQALVAL